GQTDPLPNQRPPNKRSQAVARESMGSLAAFSAIALALIRFSAARTTSLARLRTPQNSPKLSHQFRQTGCRTTSNALAAHPPGHRRGSSLLTWYRTEGMCGRCTGIVTDEAAPGSWRQRVGRHSEAEFPRPFCNPPFDDVFSIPTVLDYLNH